MNIRPYLDWRPDIGRNVWIDPAATVIGRVTIGEDASIWPGAVVRGDVNAISIGARTSIQDGSVLHVASRAAGRRRRHPARDRRGVHCRPRRDPACLHGRPALP